jgi:hypothetical protein
MGNNLNFKTIRNKQQKPVVREEKILKRKKDKPGMLLEITKIRNVYAPVSRRFDGWSRCCKILNEEWTELVFSRFFDLLCRRCTCGISSTYFATVVLVVSAYYVKETLGQHHHLCCVIRRSATNQGGPLKANSHQKKIGASVEVEMKCHYGGSV